MLSKRLVAAAALTGVAASLPMIVAGTASAHTAAPAVVKAVAPAEAPEVAKQAAPASYTVVSGDVLSKIASSHNVDGGWQKLYDMNKNVLTQGPNRIFPGEKLVLTAVSATPAPAKPAAPAAQAPVKHVAPAPVKHVAAAAVKHVAAAPAAKPAQSVFKASAPTYTGGSIQALAQSMVPANQWASFNQIITHESGWNPHATNASSGAYGLGQALPGSKMASAGSDWQTNPATQLKWTLNYMNSRYGSPNAAWAFWQTHHWY